MLKNLIYFVLILCLAIAMGTYAQTVQGEDPVALNQKIQTNMLPWNTATQVNIPQNQEIPAWLDAKLARFQAKAFAANTDGVVTDERVTSTTIQDGARKICIQDIGSSVSNANNAPFNRYGPKTDPQVVVLRGDLVNICR